MTTAQFTPESIQQSIQDFITQSGNIQTEVQFEKTTVKVIQSPETNYQKFHTEAARVLPDDVDEWTTDELYDYLTEDTELPDL